MSLHSLVIQSFQSSPVFPASVKSIQANGKTIAQGLYGSSKGLFVGSIFQATENSILVLTSTTREAEEIYQDIRYFFPEIVCEMFPSWEMMPYERISPFSDVIHHRVMVLHKIVSGERLVVVAPVQAALQNIIPLPIFKNLYIDIKKGEEMLYELLIEEIAHLGYKRTSMVEGSGEFSVKGDILDIFPSSMENPVRIEFFGDTIERVRTFDALSQRMIEEIDFVEILPQRELIYDKQGTARALEKLSTDFSNQLEKKEIVEYITNGIYFNGIEHLTPLFYEPFCLLDYLPEALVVLNEEERISKAEKRLLYEAGEIFHSSHKHQQVKPSPQELYSSYDKKLAHRKSVELYFLTRFDTDNAITFKIGTPDGFKESISRFSEYVKGKIEEGYRFGILASYEGQAKRLKDILSVPELSPVLEGDLIDSGGKIVKQKTKENDILISTASLSSGFILHDTRFYLLMDREIFGRKRSFFKKIHKVNSTPIESFFELSRGDYVVHVNYGIGKFFGIERIKAYNKEKDYIKLIYAESETLYIPIEQMNLVQKYIGGSGNEPTLDKLGSKSWEKTKSRVKKALEQMAGELARLYKSRLENRGIACAPDSEWQMQFEASFEYDETPDQLNAIIDAKKDMESLRTMDRLICGDVGYGKTEVAMRACFKAVMNGMQVGILVPTTILCEQHFETFKERFKNFPVEIRMLSRFCSPKDIEKTVKQLKEGQVDVAIGTHRLLSSDIHFKNLGLVIIDEEQKFGVRHKESLKKFRTMVDVISLSATPIPRTLHMSLASIRDISIINTPPENRLPIDTYIMEFNENIIRDAIQREVKRGGQVFFLHNRVRTIYEFSGFIQKLCPAVSIGVAHGQMSEHELEEVMHKFINGKFDVLVCTTIIESGLDIPNANTILIDRADALGLSQLYQLRGRVGRSKNKAYCYLFYPEDMVLSEIAQKRLAAIREFTDLGSGFKIAMKDLEIRGAGNILGPEQSGDIAAVGFDLYCKLLKETVDEVIGGSEIDSFETFVDLRYDGFIPDSYIPDEKQKFEIYKKIVGCTTFDDIADIKQELKDRFGEYPSIVGSLLSLSYLKVEAKTLRVSSVVETSGQINIEFDRQNKIDVKKLLNVVTKDKTLVLNPNKPNTLIVTVDEDNEETLSEKLNRLHELFNKIKITNAG